MLAEKRFSGVHPKGSLPRRELQLKREMRAQRTVRYSCPPGQSKAFLRSTVEQERAHRRLHSIEASARRSVLGAVNFLHRRFRFTRTLGDGLISCPFSELSELRIGHRVIIDPESVKLRRYLRKPKASQASPGQLREAESKIRWESDGDNAIRGLAGPMLRMRV